MYDQSFQRDLAWQHPELMYRSSIAHQFARYALALNYEFLPQDVIHQAKPSLLDVLGCAIGGPTMLPDFLCVKLL